jgi:hypothetical protein
MSRRHTAGTDDSDGTPQVVTCSGGLTLPPLSGGVPDDE